MKSHELSNSDGVVLILNVALFGWFLFSAIPSAQGHLVMSEGAAMNAFVQYFGAVLIGAYTTYRAAAWWVKLFGITNTAAGFILGAVAIFSAIDQKDAMVNDLAAPMLQDIEDQKRCLTGNGCK